MTSTRAPDDLDPVAETGGIGAGRKAQADEEAAAKKTAKKSGVGRTDSVGQ